MGDFWAKLIFAASKNKPAPSSRCSIVGDAQTAHKIPMKGTRTLHPYCTIKVEDCPEIGRKLEFGRQKGDISEKNCF